MLLVSPTTCDGCGAIVKAEPCPLCGHRNFLRIVPEPPPCFLCGGSGRLTGGEVCDACEEWVPSVAPEVEGETDQGQPEKADPGQEDR